MSALVGKMCLSRVHGAPCWSYCSKPQAVVRDLGGELLSWKLWRELPRQAQCDICASSGEVVAILQRDAHAHAPRNHILSSVLLCGALARAWTPDMVRLLEQWLHDEDDAARVILLDAAGQMGLGEPPIEGQPPPWGGERREWLAAPGKCGTEWAPHTWFVRRREGIDDSLVELRGGSRQCTCGVFEDEYRQIGRHVGGAFRQLAEDINAGLVHFEPCPDLNCQREAGHDPPHMARSAVHGWNGIEEHIDEWFDGEIPFDRAHDIASGRVGQEVIDYDG